MKLGLGKLANLIPSGEGVKNAAKATAKGAGFLVLAGAAGATAGVAAGTTGGIAYAAAENEMENIDFYQMGYDEAKKEFSTVDEQVAEAADAEVFYGDSVNQTA